MAAVDPKIASIFHLLEIPLFSGNYAGVRVTDLH